MDAPAASARGDPTQPAAQNVSIESRRASQCSAGTWQNPPPEWPSVAGSQWVSLAWPKFTSGLWCLSQKRPVEKFNFGWSCIYVYMNDTPTFWKGQSTGCSTYLHFEPKKKTHELPEGLWSIPISKLTPAWIPLFLHHILHFFREVEHPWKKHPPANSPCSLVVSDFIGRLLYHTGFLENGHPIEHQPEKTLQVGRKSGSRWCGIAIRWEP